MILLGAIAVLAASFMLVFYTYVGYPACLYLLSKVRDRATPGPEEVEDWPRISVSVPAYNEEAQISDLLESLLALDDPRDRMQIVVVSDASTDRTDEIVRGFADEGVELVRLAERGGKTRAENAVAEYLTGDIIVNTDASIRIAPQALRRLVAVFSDPGIGCASGRDVSVGADDEGTGAGESGYVGYEMMIRDLETKVEGIVGASGCFYAIRPSLHRLPLPEALSRDFAAALHTREHGYRAVSVSEAVCFVPRAPALRREYRRKVRTMTRGMQTLWYKRSLLNPLRQGLFAWMLFSHKVCRWALPWAALAGIVALAALTPYLVSARVLFGGALLGLILAAVGWITADARGPRIFTVPAYLVASNVGAAHALLRTCLGIGEPVWEPTRRPVINST